MAEGSSREQARSDERIVFINYRQTDSGWPAQTLSAGLRPAFGDERVFLDVRSIEAGDEFGEEIQDHLRRAAVLIVVVGERWLFAQDRFGRRRLDSEEDWVRREICHGLADPRCVVVPVLVDDAALPDDPSALPEDIRPLLDRQDVRLRLREAGATIVALVETIVKAGVPRAAAPREGAERPKRAISDEDVAPYLSAVEGLYEHIAVAGFETRLRVPIQLEDMYVPLDAMVDPRRFGDGCFGSADEAEELLQKHASEDGQVPLTEAFKRADELGGRRGLVMLGDPGSGKTTHLQRLLLWLVREGPESIGLPAGMVPVFLPLRNLRDLDSGLDAFIESELAGPHLTVEEGFGRRLLGRGNLLFLLDGLDEVPNPRNRAKVSRWIEAAMGAPPSSRFVVTCRYAGYTGKAQLDGRLLELHLRPLDGEQASAFVHNWYRIVETSLATDKERARIVAAEQAQALVEKLRQPDFRARRVFELTRNPLLLTGICLVHRDSKTLPHRRADLYDECINVLLERWRTSKELGVSMGAKAARRVLQAVAHWLHQEDGRTRATAEELVPVIEPELVKVKGEATSAAEFLRTIRDESGLLTGWSGEQYGFMHLGFQEYLAARRVKDLILDRPDVLEDLARNFGSSWWREVSLLLLALDGPPIFERFMRLVVEQPGFAKHPDLVEECFDDALEVSHAPLVELLRREPGKKRELWERQLAALRLLQQRAPEEVGALADSLARHPHRAIAELLERPSRERDRVQADRGGYELVRIPGGKFAMGSTEAEQERWAAGNTHAREWFARESPRHEVELAEFFLGVQPVTNEAYGRYLEANPGTKEPKHWSDRQYNQSKQPVVGVSWDEAIAYCEWAGLVLPTEAQWEYACRARTTKAFWSGDQEEDLARVGWYDGNSEGRLHPVGEKPANPFGLHDVHGNVREWCRDWFGWYEVDPAEGPEGERHVEGSGRRAYRGGGFGSGAGYARSACRYDGRPSYRYGYLGFRAAWVPRAPLTT